MLFESKKKKQEVIQRTLQAEDDAFHRTIIALERLEKHLLDAAHSGIELEQTAVGTSRDLHDMSVPVADDSMYYLELQLDCKGLYMCASYDNSEHFRIAVESFMKDLLEWYAGRNLLDRYDAVDMAIIPLMAAITQKSDLLDELFEKYVFSMESLSSSSLEKKYEAVHSGIESWIKAQHYMEHSKETPHDEESELITSHRRGAAIEGYKRIISALSARCDSSAPLKLFVKMVKEYLPSVADQLPTVTDEAIDRIYDKAAKGATDEVPTKSPIPGPGPVVEKKPGREEKYARIRKLAAEIIDLVNSLDD